MQVEVETKFKEPALKPQIQSELEQMRENSISTWIHVEVK
jgi:hypothetical protein